MQTFIDKLTDALPIELIVVLAALIGLVFVTWKLALFWANLKSRPCEQHAKEIKILQESTAIKEELPCKGHDERIGEVKEIASSHENNLTEINTTLKFISKSIEDMKVALGQKVIFTQQHSPLTINDLGKEVIKKLGIDKMFDRNWSRIKPYIAENTESQNPYDINELCIKHAVVYPEHFLSKDDIGVLKEDAYKRGVTLFEYMKIIAVMARDRYFEEEGIEVEDIH